MRESNPGPSGLKPNGLVVFLGITNLANSHNKDCAHRCLTPDMYFSSSFRRGSTVIRECQPIHTQLRESKLKEWWAQTFLEACDLVAKKEFSPTLPDLPLELEDEEETVKIVQLVKSNEPLGATIRYDQEAGAIVIARIMHGGAADRSGLIHIGDEVHEVNGIDVRGKPPCELVKILEVSGSQQQRWSHYYSVVAQQHSREGPITFKLVPGPEWPGMCGPESRVRVKAHFCYDPGLDPAIPCREAGLGFVRGEVLHVVNQTDPGWWQARRHGDHATCAGLVPSRQLMERRLAALRDLTPPSCHPRRIRKIMYHAAENDDFDREELATYEEVATLYPTPGLHRPIVLVGAPGIGRNELRRRLCQLDPGLYRSPVAHTSRPPRPWEVDGHDYYFASRAFMEAHRPRFVELGEYQGHLYGTCLDTIEQIVAAGQVCLMAPHPQDEEFEEIVYESQKLEYLYGHMFDAVVSNYQLGPALRELAAIVDQKDSFPF
ncbi:MPP7 [Cordylochernes scorpioides]|uniref:MPP7 n=1 Tax=Cordylochernes scorpioides TaxID=51811 RepID=A0ABY6L9D4_9ARAC|nr:MPP7 [Cordylochernes scorpioides]